MMDYEKAYKEALERAKSFQEKYGGDYAGYIFPELRESEDERIRKELVAFFIEVRNREGNEGYWHDLKVADILAYLEKQKINTEGDFGRGYDCGYEACLNSHGAEWLEKQKEQKPSCWNSPVMTHEMIMNEQKEPKYTKRNALFDKCVENCDPKTVEEVNKRVDDIMNMSELSAFEQALTNFIGYWEDDEERWPSKFVKKHGKHILDMAREELQKEQIPYIDFVIKPHKGDDNNPYDMSVSEAQEYAIKRGFGVPFNDGEVYVDERHITQTIGNILRWADEHPKEQKPVSDDLEEAADNPFEAQHKMDLIKAVLECRADILEHIVEKETPDEMFFRGKLEGYLQAIELLTDTVECIKVELE